MDAKAGLYRRTAALQACSACAGDYEDPDRSVPWASGEGTDDRDDAPDADAEEFPAEA